MTLRSRKQQPRRWRFAATLGLALGLHGAALHAAPLTSWTFSDPFTLSGAGHTFNSTGGQLGIVGSGGSTDASFALPGISTSTPFSISTQLTTDGCGGCYNIGLIVGNNRVVFHPGYGGSAMRIEGPGTATGAIVSPLGNNTDVGFTPAINVMHTLTVAGDGAGNFSMTLQNGGGAGSYTRTWSNPTNPLTQIAVLRSGPGGTSIATFDNFTHPASTLGTFSQNFSAVTGTTAASGNISTTSGQLRMTTGAGASDSFRVPGYTGNLLVSGDVGAIISAGTATAGISIGGNTVAFQPGTAGGNLGVSGMGGFSAAAMGFTPASGALQNMEIAVDATTGRFTIAVADAANPNNVYAGRFTNAGYVGGAASPIGYQYSTTATANTGLYDNLTITQLQSSADGVAEWVSAVQASNPRHWYRLSETTSNIAVDSGSARQHGVYQNGITKGLAGIANGAVSFDGANDQINLGAANLAGPWTAEFVVNKQGLETVGALLNGPNGALRLDQWNNTGEVGYTAFSIADHLFTPGASLTEDEFYHLVFTGDPTEGLDVYLGGFLVGENSTYMALPLNLLGGPDTANMLLDEVAIYDRILSEEEIFAHAEALGLEIVPEPQSIALWSLLGAGAFGFAMTRRRKK